MIHPTPGLTKAFAFYVIACALAVLVAISRLGTSLYMFTPTAAVLITMLAATRDGYSRASWSRLGLHRLGVRAWPVALLVPFAIMAFAYGASGLPAR